MLYFAIFLLLGLVQWIGTYMSNSALFVGYDPNIVASTFVLVFVLKYVFLGLGVRKLFKKQPSMS
ncbi:hypothetical protein C0583_05695 [Candidatus Parcubacteria bacterium]|nr:MAG: hypothetical protein C0583_05695 [Candidatus Parcubacteria bacterium]